MHEKAKSSGQVLTEGAIFTIILLAIVASIVVGTWKILASAIVALLFITFLVKGASDE